MSKRLYPRTINIKDIKSYNKSRRRTITSNRKHKKTGRKNVRSGKNNKMRRKTAKRGGSVMPTGIVHIFDSISYGIMNLSNILQGVEIRDKN